MKTRNALLAAGALLAASPATAAAAPALPAPTTLLSATVTAPAAQPTACTTRLAQAGRGVVHRRFTLPATGAVAARLVAAGGDWDVAIYDARTRHLVAGSAGFNAVELAQGHAGAGRELIVQACRRKGATRTAQLRVTSVPVPPATTATKTSLLKVHVRNHAEKTLLGTFGFDLTEHAGHDYVEVVAYGDADRRRLQKAGFRYDVVVDDMAAQNRKDFAATKRYATRVAASPLPSGRDMYRRLPDYEAEMKRLVERFPGLVKPITLRYRTIEGRQVHGIEITQNVNAADGKPIFFQMGVHHAREWPSGEHAIEFAYELVNGYGKNPRITDLVNRTRTIVVPIVNPDGFNVSREGGAADTIENPAYEQIPEGGLLQSGAQTPSYLADPAGAYRRRNCRLVPSQPTAPPGLCASPSSRPLGVDPNRNYGGLWGGPGASALPTYDTYRGAGPFSEPETQNVRDLVSRRHVTTLITNHTFSNLVLRPPGVRAQGPPADEPIYRDLGLAMARQNGYTNQPSYALYDTTGTTEDWSYYATGGLGFTFEIGPDVDPSECGGFHPRFECTVKQYVSGQNNAGGNREAYLIALENTASKAKHATIVGTAPKGVTLRVKKEFITETSPVRPAEDDLVVHPPVEGEKIRFKDTLDVTLPIGRSGRFEWSVNPSTRPAIAERLVRQGPVRRRQKIAQKEQTIPAADLAGTAPNSYEDVPFRVTEADGAKDLEITVNGTGATDDYDLELYIKKGDDLQMVSSSGNFPGEAELIIVEDPAVGDYVLRVVNYAAFAGWTGEILVKGDGPIVRRPGGLEAWTMSCEAGGKVLNSQKVVVRRGETVDVKEICGANAAEVAAAARGRRSTVCASIAGFRSTNVRAINRRRGLRFGFARRVPYGVKIDVFQVSRGRRILGNRKVATFHNLRRSYTWSGRTNTGKRLTDGYYFVRYRIRGRGKAWDFRRHVLVRRNGRFYGRRSHHDRSSCGLLYSTKLERPVFGGRGNLPQFVVFRVRRRSDVTITVRRGKRVVRVMRTRRRAAFKTHRLRFPAERARRRGAYTFTITARSGGKKVTRRLYAQRL
jgi:hypothetical protein